MYVCRYSSDGIVTRIVSTDAVYNALVREEHIVDGRSVGILAKLPKTTIKYTPLQMVENKMLRVVKKNSNGTLEVELAEKG